MMMMMLMMIMATTTTMMMKMMMMIFSRIGAHSYNRVVIFYFKFFTFQV